MALFGTGIKKGPFAVEKEYANWNDDGEYDPNFKLVPQVSHVSIWDFYPDPDATNMDDANTSSSVTGSTAASSVISRSAHTSAEAIDMCIEMGENFNREIGKIRCGLPALSGHRAFEVLEYWGCFDRYYMEEVGIELPEACRMQTRYRQTLGFVTTS